jgi:hypothetical protein
MFVALVIVMTAISSCVRHNPANQNRSPNRNDPNLANKSIEFFAWSEAGQKREYLRLEKWKDTGNVKDSHPKLFDVVCQIENKSDSAIQEGDFIILTTIDFLVAPDNAVDGDINKLVKEYGWSRDLLMDDVKMGVTPYMQKGENAQIKLQGFDLNPVVKLFYEDDQFLWAWALKVNINIIDRNMKPVAHGEAILPMIPADGKFR